MEKQNGKFLYVTAKTKLGFVFYIDSKGRNTTYEKNHVNPFGVGNGCIGGFFRSGLRCNPPAVSSSEAEESSEAPEEESSQEPESSEEESSMPEESSEEPEESSEPESSEEESSSTTITGKFNSIEEYVNSDLLQNQLGSMLDSYKDAGIDIKLVGEGNKLIYLCTLSDEYASIDGMAETLEEGLDDQASTYESIASSLKLAVNVEDPVVEVRYQTESGKVLCSREYSAK